VRVVKGCRYYSLLQVLLLLLLLLLLSILGIRRGELRLFFDGSDLGGRWRAKWGARRCERYARGPR